MPAANHLPKNLTLRLAASLDAVMLVYSGLPGPKSDVLWAAIRVIPEPLDTRYK
jgi:hypothetical protein